MFIETVPWDVIDAKIIVALNIGWASNRRRAKL